MSASDSHDQAIRAQADRVRRQPWLLDLVNAVSEIVLILNADRRIVFAHNVPGQPALLIGRRPGEALGCLHADESPGGCQTSAYCHACDVLAAIGASLDTRQPGSREAALAGADAHDRHYLVRSTPVTLEGEPFLIVALADRSAEVRLRALEKYFFHDILNLAVAVRGAAELLAEAPADQQAGLSGMIHATSDALVRDILDQRDLAALENCEWRGTQEAVGSRDILREALQHWQGDAARGRRLVLEPGCRDVRFETDRTLLLRALHLLLRSAVEPAAPGETITLSCGAEGGRVRFTIRHPSVIPPRARAILFQHPFSIENSLRVWSVYVAWVITNHYLGGRLTVRSEDGSGTEMTLETGIRAPAPEPGPPPPAPVLDGSFAARHPLRILVVEDNPMNRRLNVRLLEKLGYRPDQAAGGLEALAALGARPYDLALMDVEMPDLDGLETTRRLRAMSPPCPTRVIGVTAHSLETEAALCAGAGMDGCLTKPLDLAALARHLARLTKSGEHARS